MYEDVAGTPTIVSTGYASAAIKVTDGSKITDTTSFVLATNTIPAGNKIDGVITLTKTGLTDKWTIGGSLHDNTANEMFTVGGSITLSNQTAGIILFNGGSTSFTGGDWSYDYTAQLQYE